MATFGGKDQSSGPGGQGSDAVGGKAGAGAAGSNNSGGSYSVGADRNSQAGAQAVAAAAMRARLNATPTQVMAGASGGWNSMGGLLARDPLTAAAVQAQNNYDAATQGLGPALLDQIGISPLDPTSRLQNSLRTGVIPGTNPDWGLDIPGIAAGVAGQVTGLPIGTGYNALRTLGQRTGLIGPNFGKFDVGYGPNAQVANAAHGGSNNDQGGGFGPGGAKNVNQLPRSNFSNAPQATQQPAAAPAPPPPPTWADEIAGLTPRLRQDFDWNMSQRGLGANATDMAGNPINWDDVFNQEFAHRQAGVPLGVTKGSDQSAFDDAANQYLLPNFGASALDDYQTQARAQGKNTIDAQGLGNEINSRFGQSTIQPYLDSIYGTQYGAAKQLLDNVNARGEFNQFGYNAGLKDLDTQGVAGKATLSDLGNSYLTTDKGTLNDALSGIYDKIGKYTLGSGYNPNADVSNLKGQEDTLSGNLQGQITGAAPSLFDMSSLLQRASSQQGATSGGTLSDTLAQRNLNSGRSRGLSNAGAF